MNRNEKDIKQVEDKALFRYRLIAPLLDPDLKRGDRHRIYEALADRSHLVPSGKEVRFSRETLRKWYKHYRKFGFEGLKAKSRNDYGKCRVLPAEVIKKACDLKIEVPQRSVLKIIDILEREGIVEKGKAKKSTLHAIFQRKQLTSRIPKEKGYWHRYQAEFPNDLWQSDQMAGPWIVDPKNPRQKIRAQLLAWLDDCSRVIVHGQFFFNAKLANLEHCLRKAVQKMGLPKKIYVDNGQIYSSKHLASICAHLGVRLMFARPYCPEGKGKIERFFGYVRSAFLPEVYASKVVTLEQLNESFRAWLELAYHRKIHSQLQKAPLEVFLAHKEQLHYPAEEELKEAFLYRETRKIHKDCTFQLLGSIYEVMPALVGQEVEIRFDPDDLGIVKIYLAGDFFQQAKILDIAPQCCKPILTPEEKVKTGIDYLKRLREEHKNQVEEMLLGPRSASDDRFILTDLLTILERKGFHLSSFERKEVQRYFDTYGPFEGELAVQTLEKLVQMKGLKQHISFYMEKIAEAQQNKRRNGYA